MSQHPSLRSSGKDKAQRSVLKRYERIKILKEKDKWKDEESVYGLPKVKIVKFKVKKEKAAAVAEEGAAAPGAAPAAPAAGAAASKASPAKEAGKPAAGAEAKKGSK